MPYLSAVAPPPGFDPVTADAAQLSCYGYPARPSLPAQLANWNALMENARGHYVWPAHEVQIQPPAGADTHPVWGQVSQVYKNWAGYDAPATDNTGLYNLHFTEASTYIAMPEVNDLKNVYLGCNQKRVGGWVGIGGDPNSSALNQVGVYGRVASPPAYSLFWEDGYAGGPYDITEVPVTGGDQVYVSITETYQSLNQGTTRTTYYVQDITHPEQTSFAKTTSNAYNAGDAIVEEPDSYPDGDWMDFFDRFTFSDTMIGGQYGAVGENSTSGNIDGFNYVQDILTDQITGLPAASPDAIGSEPGGGFDVTPNRDIVNC